MMEVLDKNPELDPGECAGCGKHVEFRGVKDGKKYCTNCCELGNFVDDEGEKSDPEDPDEEDGTSYAKNPGPGRPEEETEEERPECPYCGEPQDKKGIGPHKRFCDENPDNQDGASADDAGETDEEPEPDVERSTSDDKTDEPDENSTPPERVKVDAEDEEGGRSEDTEGNGGEDSQPAGNGDTPVTDHYYVSVIQVDPPEYDDSIFVAYTENRSHSDESPEKAVAGLVGNEN